MSPIELSWTAKKGFFASLAVIQCSGIFYRSNKAAYFVDGCPAAEIGKYNIFCFLSDLEHHVGLEGFPFQVYSTSVFQNLHAYHNIVMQSAFLTHFVPNNDDEQRKKKLLDILHKNGTRLQLALLVHISFIILTSLPRSLLLQHMPMHLFLPTLGSFIGGRLCSFLSLVFYQSMIN